MYNTTAKIEVEIRKRVLARFVLESEWRNSTSMTAMNRPSSTFPNRLHTNENKSSTHKLYRNARRLRSKGTNTNQPTADYIRHTAYREKDGNINEPNDWLCNKHIHLVTHCERNSNSNRSTKHTPLAVSYNDNSNNNSHSSNSGSDSSTKKSIFAYMSVVHIVCIWFAVLSVAISSNTLYLDCMVFFWLSI